MTNSNLNKLKIELFEMYKKTGDAHTLVNECVRLGMLVERTKNDDKEITLNDVYAEFKV